MVTSGRPESSDTFVWTYHFGHKGSIVVEEGCSTEGGEAAGQSTCAERLPDAGPLGDYVARAALNLEAN